MKKDNKVVNISAMQYLKLLDLEIDAAMYWSACRQLTKVLSKYEWNHSRIMELSGINRDQYYQRRKDNKWTTVQMSAVVGAFKLMAK